MVAKITLLSPFDLKPGAVSPTGKVVQKATLYADKKNLMVDVWYTDGTYGAFLWPSGSGWTVNGKTAE